MGDRAEGAGNELSAGLVFGPVVQAGSIGSLQLPPVSIPPVRVPRQLPPAPESFVNRNKEMATLEALLSGRDERPRVVVLSGLGGVGKTGLGVHWARAASDRFDGGQLYADLAVSRHRGGVEVGDVLGGFLRSLGVREEWLPEELAERMSLYRSVVADRRMLVLLDNVEHPAQVTPLVPGSPGSVVVVTSRSSLTGLLVAGASLIRLEPLNEEEGVRLLGAMVTDGRVEENTQAAAQLVRMVGGLPIALRVCGAHLAVRARHGIDRLSAALADEEQRLRRLTAEGKPIVEAVFDAAYAGLPADAATLYRALGTHPGPEFSAELIGAVARRHHVDDLRNVEILLEASLLEEVGEERYRFHDLVRLHARARAGAERGTARAIVDWYLSQAKAADQAVLGKRLRLADQENEAVFTTPDKALGWLERERSNLLAAVRLAANEQWDAHVWQFGEALWALYDNRAHHTDELEVAGLGAEAALRCGNRPAEARMRNHMVRALLRAGELGRAATELPVALDAAADCGHLRIESAVIETCGFVRLAQADHAAAIDAFHRSRRINAEVGNERGVGLQNYHLGIALCDAGRDDAAVQELTSAMEIMKAVPDELSQAKIGTQLGAAYQGLGRTAEAVPVLTRAVEIFAARDMPQREAHALDLLAEVVDGADDARALRSRAESLRTMLRTNGDRE